MAAQKVFEVTELLEYILSYVPPRDLLLSQRACKKFKDAIAESPLLQRTLFMRAPQAPTPNLTLPTLNPLLVQQAQGPRQYIFCHKDMAYCIGFPQDTDATNPLPVIERKDGGIWHLNLDILAAGPVRSTTLAWLCKVSHCGSWQDMYFSDPPCGLHVRVRGGNDEDVVNDCLEIGSEPFGDVLGRVWALQEVVRKGRWRE